MSARKYGCVPTCAKGEGNMNDVFLLLGGNLGDRFYFLHRAAQEITQEIGAITRKSSLYETEPWGFEHANHFLNQIVRVSTNLNPQELLTRTQAIEKRLGRIRKTVKKGYEGRKIDIDILFFANRIMNSKELHIPHLRLHERRFTLMPLVEIAPDYVHPIFLKTNTELLAICEDDSEVKRLGFQLKAQTPLVAAK